MKKKKWIVPTLVGVAVVAAIGCMICDDIWARRLLDEEYDEDLDDEFDDFDDDLD